MIPTATDAVDLDARVPGRARWRRQIARVVCGQPRPAEVELAHPGAVADDETRPDGGVHADAGQDELGRADRRLARRPRIPVRESRHVGGGSAAERSSTRWCGRRQPIPRTRPRAALADIRTRTHRAEAPAGLSAPPFPDREPYVEWPRRARNPGFGCPRRRVLVSLGSFFGKEAASASTWVVER
jgi:hypothetical protein